MDFGILRVVYTADTRNVERAASQVDRINRQTARNAEQNDRLLERSAKTLADVRAREGRRAANEIIRDLEREQRARREALRGGSPGLGRAGSIVGGVAAAAGIASVTATLVAGGRAWLDYSAKLENARISFATMMGSAQAAEAHLKELQQFALKTPFEFTELVDASARMRALGFETKEVIPLLRDVGNVTAASGEISEERLQRIIKALSDVRSRGALYSQEIRQFAEAAIPVYDILEKQLGKTRAELVKMVEAGKITAPIFFDAFQKFSRENFGDLMEKQSRTFRGAMSNIKDTLLQTAGTAFQPMYDRITEIAVRFADMLQGQQGIKGVVNASDAALQEIGRQIGRSIAAGIAEELRSLDITSFLLSGRLSPASVSIGIGKGILDNTLGPTFGAEIAAASSARGFRTVNEKPGTSRPGAAADGKGGASAARRAARQALQLAQIDLREAESIYQEGVAIARRALDSNLTDFADFLQRRKELERERFKAAQSVFGEERAAAGDLPTAGERRVKLAEIAQRERDELRDHNERMASLTAEGAEHRQDILTRFAATAVRVQEERNRVLEADLASQLAQGTKTYKQALEERLVALSRAAEAEQEVLRLGLVRALGGPDTQAARQLSETISQVLNSALNASDIEQLQAGFKEILAGAANREAVQEALQEILLFFLKRRQAFQQGNADAREATRQDLENWQSYAEELRRIGESISDAVFEARDLQVSAAERRPFERNASIEARRVLERAREEERAAQVIAELDAGRERVRLTEQNEQRRAEIITQINEQIVAEQIRTIARLDEIDRQATEARRERLIEISHDLADILGAGLRDFRGEWSDIWRSMLFEALDVVRRIADELLRLSLEVLLTGSTSGSNAGGILGSIVNSIGGALFGTLFSGAGSAANQGARDFLGSNSYLSNLYRGGRATGGPVEAGMIYETHGLNRREFFIPHTDGKISNNPEGAGGNIYNYYTITTPAPRSASYVQRRASREVAETIAATLRARG